MRSAPLQVRTGEGGRDASSELRATHVCGNPYAAAVRHVSHLAVTAGRGCSGQADSSEAEAIAKDPSISAGPLQHERRLLLPVFSFTRPKIPFSPWPVSCPGSAPLNKRRRRVRRDS